MRTDPKIFIDPPQSNGVSVIRQGLFVIRPTGRTSLFVDEEGASSNRIASPI
jgi:hypothetical protein